MTLSKSLLSYVDIKPYLEKVVNDGKAVVLTFKTGGEKAAMRWVQRANMFRRLDRDNNAKLHEDPQHPLHGRSEFDPLLITRVGNKVRITELSLDVEVEVIE